MPNYYNYPMQTMPNGMNYGQSSNNYPYGYRGDSYTYQNPQMIQQIPQQPISYNYDQPQTSNPVVWVQGEAGANAYPVGRGQTVMLMDANPNSNMFYLKSADAYSGRPLPLEKYHYTRVYDANQNDGQSVLGQQSEQHKYSNNEAYVPREEFESLKAQLEQMQKMLNEFKE